MQESFDELEFDQLRDRTPEEMRVNRRKIFKGITIFAIVMLIGGVLTYTFEKKCLADPACNKAPERLSNP